MRRKPRALFHSLVKNHPFHNGNKRTALVALIVFLAKNDRRFDNNTIDDEIFEFVTGVAASNLGEGRGADDEVSDIATWIRNRTVRNDFRARSMRPNEFLDCCRQADLVVKELGGSWLVRGERGTIKFSKSTGELTGNVVRGYVRQLGIKDPTVSLAEFQDGLEPTQEAIRRFRAVLIRLANA
ncbi:type II toxin-antitoxin system death-on-curing family toxin [Polyangium spumosum]|uniref:type II toxin-antitoxin system death-on-curing family toxin n=1 Tax=Polyangium spumosum TaxID=889282 RepID=UPI0014787230|nr:type II toxin-antitoxin system death-on-curing family toxin [Polyangium spumosum]